MERLKEHYLRYRKRLCKYLLACQYIRDLSLRDEVIRELPDAIRNNLNSTLSTTDAIINNLVRVCDENPPGIFRLFEAIRYYERDSIPFRQAHQGWQAMEAEMDIQDTLLAYLKQSGLELTELQPIYEQSLPAGAQREPVFSTEDILKNLWEYGESRRAVVEFMRKVSEGTQEAQAKEEIRAWCTRALEVKVLNLSQEDIASLQLAQLRPQHAGKPYLAVVIESLREGHFTINFYRGGNGSPNECVESMREVQQENLKVDISQQIYALFIDYASNPPAVIEFYLPPSLLLLGLEIDRWHVGERLLVERCPVVIGTLDRQRALYYEKDNAQLDEKTKKLKRKELGELIMAISEWKAQWANLNTTRKKTLSSITRLVTKDEIDKIKDLSSLRAKFEDNVSRSVAFNFVPSEELLKQPLLVGLPVILWLRQHETGPDPQHNIKHALHLCLCDQCRNKPFDEREIDQCQAVTIDNADDMIEIIRKVRKHARINAEDEHHIGRHLTFILDNPERDIPIQLWSAR